MLTFAIGTILTNAVLLIWSSDVRSTADSTLQDAVQIGPVFSMVSETGAFVISLGLVVVLGLWLSRSWYGRAVRAVSSNRDAAKLMGTEPTPASTVMMKAFTVSVWPSEGWITLLQ